MQLMQLMLVVTRWCRAFGRMKPRQRPRLWTKMHDLLNLRIEEFRQFALETSCIGCG